MKALTLRQPHAAALVVGVKQYETRTWPAYSAIGQRVALHAGLNDDPDGPGKIGTDALGTPTWWLPEPWTEADQVARGYEPDGDLVGVSFVRGAIIGSAILNRCLPIIDYDDAPIKPPGDPGDALVVLTNEARYPLIHGPDGQVCGQAWYGRFVPGTWAWEFIDIASTDQRCPACWGARRYALPTRHLGERPDYADCLTCDAAGRCAPIPAKGKQGLWEWTP